MLAWLKNPQRHQLTVRTAVLATAFVVGSAGS